MRDEELAQAQNWEDGGSYKVALHAAAGAVLSGLFGSNLATGSRAYLRANSLSTSFLCINGT